MYSGKLGKQLAVGKKKIKHSECFHAALTACSLSIWECLVNSAPETSWIRFLLPVVRVCYTAGVLQTAGFRWCTQGLGTPAQLAERPAFWRHRKSKKKQFDTKVSWFIKGPIRSSSIPEVVKSNKFLIISCQKSDITMSFSRCGLGHTRPQPLVCAAPGYTSPLCAQAPWMHQLAGVHQPLGYTRPWGTPAT